MKRPACPFYRPDRRPPAHLYVGPYAMCVLLALLAVGQGLSDGNAGYVMHGSMFLVLNVVFVVSGCRLWRRDVARYEYDMKLCELWDDRKLTEGEK